MKVALRLFSFVVLVLALVSVPGERTASADDVTGKIYDDVKDVLQDLIRKEASKGVVRYMLHVDEQRVRQLDELRRSGGRCTDAPPPATTTTTTLENVVAFYFHDAIDRLYTGQLGSLGREMQSGLLDLLTDATFYVVEKNANVVSTEAKAAGRTQKTDQTSFELSKISKNLVEALATRADGFAWKMYLHLECGTPLPETTTVVAKKCHALGSGKVDLTRAACSVARAVRAELTDEPKEMEFYLQELVSMLFAAQTNVGKSSNAEELFRSWSLDPKSFEQKFSAFLGSTAAQQFGASTTSCASALPSVLGDLSVSQKICWAWKLADKASVEVPLAIQQCPALKAHSVADLLDELRKTKLDDEGAIRRGLARVFASTPPVPEPQGDAGADGRSGGSTVAPSDGGTVTQGNAGPPCNFDDANLSLVIAGKTLALRKANALNPDLTATLRLLETYLSNGTELRHLSAQLGTVPAELRSLDPIEQMTVLVRAHRLLAFLRRVHDYVTETAGSQHATAEPLSDLAYQAFKSACDEDNKDICSLVEVLHTLFGDYRFRDIARYGVRADLRALATKVLDEVLPPATDWESGICKHSDRCRKFIIAFAGYAVDMATNHGDDKAARAAFKSAAEDVLAGTADERRAFPAKGEATIWWETFLVPSASFRLSWSPDYYNGVGADQFRYLMSIDWLTLLRWAPFRNVGVQLSVIDLAAPFTELAYRPRVHTVNGGYVALDLLRPRFDVIFAVPEFSRRLMLSAGVSWKAYSTEIRPAPTSDELPTLTYRAFTDCLGIDDTSCQGYRGSAEFNFGLKLVF